MTTDIFSGMVFDFYRQYNINLIDELGGEQFFNTLIDMELRELDPQRFSPANEGKRQTLEAIIETAGKALILGGTGGGKTTLLKRAAKLKAQSRRYNDLVPLYIDLNGELRHSLVDRLLSEVDRLDGVPPDVARRNLDNGGYLLLIDSSDECTDYKAAVSQINELAQAYGKNRILVACRSNDYQRDLRHFKVFELLPLDLRQIKELLEKQGVDRREQLYQEIEQDTRLEELCTNPLFLTWVAEMYTEPKRKFLKSRSALFENITYRKLTNWEKKDEKRVKRLTELKYPVLEELAFEMQSRLGGMIPYEEAKRFMLDAIRRLDTGMRDELLAIIREFGAEEIKEKLSNEFAERDRTIFKEILSNNLVRYDEHHDFKFVHRALQEYLCARYLARQGLAGATVEKYARDPKWHETLVFLSGILDDSTGLVKRVILSSEQDVACTYLKQTRLYKFIRRMITRPKPDVALIALATRCAAEARKVDSATLKNLHSLVKEKIERGADYEPRDLLRGIDLRYHPKAIGLVASLFRHQNSFVRWQAYSALSKTREPKALEYCYREYVPLLEPDLKSEILKELTLLGHQEARTTLVQGFYYFCVRDKVFPKKFLDSYFDQIGAQKMAVDGLFLDTSSEPTPDIDDFLLSMDISPAGPSLEDQKRLQDLDVSLPGHSLSYCIQLCEIDYNAFAPLLIALITQDTDEHQKFKCISALVENSPDSKRTLNALYDIDDPSTKIAVAIFYKRSEFYNKDLSFLERVLSEGTEAVKSGVAGVLKEIQGPEAEAIIERALSNDYFLVRMRAVEALGQLRKAEDVPKIKALFEGDSERVVRHSCAYSLGILYSDGDPKLEMLLRNPDEKIKLYAARGACSSGKRVGKDVLKGVIRKSVDYKDVKKYIKDISNTSDESDFDFLTKIAERELKGDDIREIRTICVEAMLIADKRRAIDYLIDNLPHIMPWFVMRAEYSVDGLPSRFVGGAASQAIEMYATPKQIQELISRFNRSVAEYIEIRGTFAKRVATSKGKDYIFKKKEEEVMLYTWSMSSLKGSHIVQDALMQASDALVGTEPHTEISRVLSALNS